MRVPCSALSFPTENLSLLSPMVPQEEVLGCHGGVRELQIGGGLFLHTGLNDSTRCLVVPFKEDEWPNDSLPI